MFHQHNHALDAGDQIHGAAHALHHLARDHPIGEVAIFGHLQGAQDGKVNMPAADHAEGLRGIEEGTGRQLRNRLLAGIDQIGIFFAFIGEGAKAQHAVFALQLHIKAGGDVIGDQRRDADPKVHIEAIFQFARRTSGHFIAVPGHGFSPYPWDSAPAAAAGACLRTVRCSMRFS